MSMKYYCILFCMFCYSATMFGQKAFEVDAHGYISNPQFHTLIQERGYELVGNFSPIKKRSKTYYAKVLKYDLWGFIDSYGNEVIPPKYTTIHPFKNGSSIVSKTIYIDQSSGECALTTTSLTYELIDVDGNTIATYDYVNPFYFDTTVALKNGKFGMIDAKGKTTIPFEYDAIKQYAAFTIVSKDKKWSMLNRKGKPISAFIYDRFAIYNGYLLGYIGKKFAILDSDSGKQLTAFITRKGNLQDCNITRNEVNAKAKTLVVKSDEGFIVLNRKGKKITSKKYTRVEQLTDEYLSIRDGDCWGIMNSKGKIIIPTKYDLPVGYLGEGVFWRKFNDEVTYLDAKSGKEVLSQYKHIGNFRNGLAALIDEDIGKHGYINRKGKLKVPVMYDNTRYMIDANTSPLRKNSKWGILDKRGRVVIPFIYQDIRKSFKNYTARLNSKWGVLDKKGKVLMPFLYESISRFYSPKNDLYTVWLNRKCGVVTQTNRVVVPLQYDWVENRFYNGLLKVKLNDLYGYVDTTGKEVILPVYENVAHFDLVFKKTGFVNAFTSDNKEFVLDRYNNKVETSYDDERFGYIRF